MPCTVTEEEEKYYRSLDRKEKEEKQTNLEQMLCYVLTCYKAKQILAKCLINNNNLAAWWKNHQLEDAKRIAKEAADFATKKARQEALAKLTPKERAALGLNETFGN